MLFSLHTTNEQRTALTEHTVEYGICGFHSSAFARVDLQPRSVGSTDNLSCMDVLFKWKYRSISINKALSEMWWSIRGEREMTATIEKLKIAQHIKQ